NENSLSIKFYGDAYKQFKYIVTAYEELYSHKNYSITKSLYNQMAYEFLRMVIIPMVTRSQLTEYEKKKQIKTLQSDKFVSNIITRTSFNKEMPFYSLLLYILKIKKVGMLIKIIKFRFK